MNKVVVVFHLEESVTPEIFASRVAQACAAHGALREGEAVQAANSDWLHVRVSQYSVVQGRPEQFARKGES